MARGVTEKDVHGAADALVVAGGRPTVERIRARLGTGSPNTVTRMLDTWWQALPARLAAHRKSMGLPDAPPAVATLASEFWQAALGAAQVEAEQSVEGERAALVDARRDLDTERSAIEATVAAGAAELAAVQATVTLFEARLHDGERILAEQTAHLEELRIERRASAEREAEKQRAASAMQTSLNDARKTAQHDRSQLEAHIRHVESRAALEIDRARQAQRTAEAALRAVGKSQATELRVLKLQNDRAVREAAQGALEATRQRTRADTLALALALRVSRRASPARPASRTGVKAAPAAVRAKARRAKSE